MHIICRGVSGIQEQAVIQEAPSQLSWSWVKLSSFCHSAGWFLQEPRRTQIFTRATHTEGQMHRQAGTLGIEAKIAKEIMHK